MKSFTKEQIDSAVLTAAQNHTQDFQEQFINALNEVPEQKHSPAAREVLAGSIAQANAVAVLRDVLYSLLLSES